MYLVNDYEGSLITKKYPCYDESMLKHFGIMENRVHEFGMNYWISLRHSKISQIWSGKIDTFYLVVRSNTKKLTPFPFQVPENLSVRPVFHDYYLLMNFMLQISILKSFPRLLLLSASLAVSKSYQFVRNIT